MRFTRRQFLGLSGALGLSSLLNTGIKLPVLGGGKGPWSLVTLNDIHILDARSTALVDRAVNMINETPEVRLVVVLGDLATSGKLTELKLAEGSLERLEVPYLAVPGNHDVDPRAKDLFANYEKVFGSRNWTREEENWTLIGFDSCEGSESDVTVSPETIAWLEKVARKTGDKRPIALFCHHPLNPQTKAYRVKNADQILGLFAGKNLRLVASGHYHGNQVESSNGITFVTTACCAATRPNFDNTTEKGYRLFHFENEDVRTEFVTVKL